MLFWKFFFGLFIADLIFTFAWLTYNGLVVMAMVALFANREDSGNAEAEKPPIKRPMLVVLSSPFLIFAGVYIVVGWAAFVSRYASACSQTPGVEQHWLYYLFGFFFVWGPLIAGESEGERDWRKYIAAVAYVIFAFSPTLAERPYGWAIDRIVGSPAVAVNPAAEAIERGKAAETKEDWDLAITEYSNAIRLDPKCAEAYNGRGDAYLGKRDWDNTIADCTEAIRLKPDFAEAYYGRGLAYEKKRDWDNTIADCTEAIRLNPNLALAYYGRGLAYLGKRDWDNLDNTIADCTEAIRLKPDFAEAYYGRGLAYAGKGNLDKVIADCTEAIRLNPKLALAYYGRGFAYEQKGEKSKAEADFAEAKRLGYKPP
jgi:tetratricopeptide (TPR) repeat protein